MLTLREMLETLQQFAEENPELAGLNVVVADGENVFDRETVELLRSGDLVLSLDSGMLLLSL